MFGVLFVHSLPEGLAIGSAYASTRSGLSAFVIAAIAIQNVPEGTAVAIPMSTLFIIFPWPSAGQPDNRETPAVLW